MRGEPQCLAADDDDDDDNGIVCVCCSCADGLVLGTTVRATLAAAATTEREGERSPCWPRG